MYSINTLVLDWAGTTVDYGCFAPVGAFQQAFREAGFDPTIDEIRAPMGMPKRDHVAAVLRDRPHDPGDIDTVYALFETALFGVLADHAEPLPGLLDTVVELRGMGIAIGSTTGYTRQMMDVVAPLAATKGYAPDCLVCPDETGGVGRPYPYMVWHNLERLGVTSVEQVLKVGDTLADIAEGRNAGCRSVGVLEGSSLVGLTHDEFTALTPDQADYVLGTAERAYRAAGADQVIRNIAELPGLIRSLDQNGAPTS